MSGRKCNYVSVPDYELERYREQAGQLAQARADYGSLQAAYEAIGEQHQYDTQDWRRRQQRFERAMDDLSSDLRQVEEVFNDRLRHENEEFHRHIESTSRKHAEAVKNLQRHSDQRFEDQRREIQGIMEQQRNEYRTLIEARAQVLEEMLAEESRTREREVGNLQSQLTSIHADQQRKRELAATFVEDVRRVCQAIEESFDHERFAPGDLESIRGAELKAAASNISAGLPEAAVAQAQNAYHKLSELRNRLLRLQREYEANRVEALQEVMTLLDEVERNRQIEMEGKQLDLGFWTRGASDRFAKDLSEILRKVRTEAMTMEQLQEVCQDLKTYEPKFLELLDEARMRVLASQQRAEIAATIAERLRHEGYTVDEGVYESDDYREGYHVKLRMADESEIVASVLPSDQTGRSALVINSFDPVSVTEEVQRARAEAVYQSLRGEGLEVSAPEVDSRGPDNSTRDLSTIGSTRKQLKPATVTREEKPRRL